MDDNHEHVSLNGLRTQEMMLMLKHPDSTSRLLSCPFPSSGMSLFRALLDQYLSRAGLTLSEFGEKALLSRSFTYQIGNGTRMPGRDVILRTAVVLQLSVEEAQRLLRAAQRGALYPRIRRDAIVIYCLNQRYSLSQTDETLRVQGEEPLL